MNVPYDSLRILTLSVLQSHPTTSAGWIYHCCRDLGQWRCGSYHAPLLGGGCRYCRLHGGLLLCRNQGRSEPEGAHVCPPQGYHCFVGIGCWLCSCDYQVFVPRSRRLWMACLFMHLHWTLCWCHDWTRYVPKHDFFDKAMKFTRLSITHTLFNVFLFVL